MGSKSEFLAGLLAIVTIILLVLLCQARFNNWNERGMTLRTVRAVCEYTRGGDSELMQACGIAQREAKAEYMCEVRDFNTTCWVEDKADEQ